MIHFGETMQKFRHLPRKKRVLLVIVPLLLVGMIDIIKAYHSGNTGELIAVAIIFFVIMPAVALWWDRIKYRVEDTP